MPDPELRGTPIRQLKRRGGYAGNVRIPEKKREGSRTVGPGQIIGQNLGINSYVSRSS